MAGLHVFSLSLDLRLVFGVWRTGEWFYCSLMVIVLQKGPVS